MKLHQGIHIGEYKTLIHQLGHLDLHFMLQSLWLSLALNSIFFNTIPHVVMKLHLGIHLGEYKTVIQQLG